MSIFNPWDLYDRLINQVPSDLTVADCLVGLHWVLVRSHGVGIAMTPPEGERRLKIAGSINGAPVREIAALVKSWNLFESAIGLAAINSYVNAPETVNATWPLSRRDESEGDVFERMTPDIRGKKVAVVGHFPNLEALAVSCNLHILERRPQPGDFPDPACEYILPSMDYVFITGSTLINKTLPRLLSLSANARAIIVGPSTPLTPLLLASGASMLAGTVVDDIASVWLHTAEGGDRSIFRNGARMIKVS